MATIKNAPKSATTIIVRSNYQNRISRSPCKTHSLMKRLFQEEITASRGEKFVLMIRERQEAGNPIKISEWEYLLEELDVNRGSFYAMRNKLRGAGMISISKGEYRLSSEFSVDIADMANWWWSVILRKDPELFKSKFY